MKTYSKIWIDVAVPTILDSALQSPPPPHYIVLLLSAKIHRSAIFMHISSNVNSIVKYPELEIVDTIDAQK